MCTSNTYIVTNIVSSSTLSKNNIRRNRLTCALIISEFDLESGTSSSGGDTRKSTINISKSIYNKCDNGIDYSTNTSNTTFWNFYIITILKHCSRTSQCRFNTHHNISKTCDMRSSGNSNWTSTL